MKPTLIVFVTLACLAMASGIPCTLDGKTYQSGEMMPAPADMPCHVCHCSGTALGKICMKEDCSLTGH